MLTHLLDIHLFVYVLAVELLFFFFSSRRRHTRWPRDWSSDVCSSDLVGYGRHDHRHRTAMARRGGRPRRAPRRNEIGRASCRERVESRGGEGRMKEKKGGQVESMRQRRQ